MRERRLPLSFNAKLSLYAVRDNGKKRKYSGWKSYALELKLFICLWHPDLCSFLFARF